MRLTFAGAPEIPAPRDLVWRRLTDPEFVARSAPGVESVERIDDTHFKVMSGFGVGPFKLHLALDVELGNLIPPTSLTMRTRGHAPGSTIEVGADVRLEPVDGSRTRLTWTAETEVNGFAAGIGAPFLESVARKLTDHFWQAFAEAAGR